MAKLNMKEIVVPPERTFFAVFYRRGYESGWFRRARRTFAFSSPSEYGARDAWFEGFDAGRAARNADDRSKLS